MAFTFVAGYRNCNTYCSCWKPSYHHQDIIKQCSALGCFPRFKYLNRKTWFQIILGIARGLQYLHEDHTSRLFIEIVKPSTFSSPRIKLILAPRLLEHKVIQPYYVIRGNCLKMPTYSFRVGVLKIIC
uniref:Protein kinase domain-containing protein n=1 Tax=Helianthus annuus TaxID=4232 RepID=A0A251TRU6_HELAN